MKPYIEYADFPTYTPFTEQAARAAVQRGDLKEGVHFFRVGRRVVFKWSAIEAWIEKREVAPIQKLETQRVDLVPLRRRSA